MTEFQIETAEVPATTSTRTARPNPFVGKFPTPEGKSMKITLPSSTEDEVKEVNSVVNLAQKAAREAGFTCRVKREATTVGTGKNQKDATVVYLWSVPAITHKPMTDEQKAERAAKRAATMAAKRAAK